MNKMWLRFRHCEDGAVTVDWVVLTAAMVLLGLAVFSIYETAVQNEVTWIGDQMTEIGQRDP